MSILVGCMCSISCHMSLVLAFMPLYSMFNVLLFLSILSYNIFNLVLKRQTKMVKLVPASPNCICPFFMRAIPNGPTFGLYIYMFYVCKMCMFCIVCNFCQI